MPKKFQFILVAFLIFVIVIIGSAVLKNKAKSPAAKLPQLQEIIKKFLPFAQKGKPETRPADKESAQVEGPISSEPAAILVRTFKIKKVDFTDALPVMGSVKGKTEVDLKFEINGVISKIYFREGERIKKGEIIASLDPKDTQLKISYAQAKLNSSQAAYNSLLKKLEVHKKLLDAGAIIKSKYEEVELETESSRFQVETTKSELELAENELKKNSIYAPKDGVLGIKDAEEGEFLTPQDKLGKFLETEEVYVEVGIVERDIEKVKLGQKAKIHVDTYPTTIFEGTVDNIFPTVEGKSRTMTAKIKVSNQQGMLLPGMFARAEISIIELKDAVMIPATAIVPASEGVNYVPVIPQKTIQLTEDQAKMGVVQLRKIKIGYSTSDYTQILEGVETTDLVVVETQGQLDNNVKVKIIAEDEMAL